MIETDVVICEGGCWTTSQSTVLFHWHDAWLCTPCLTPLVELEVELAARRAG